MSFESYQGWVGLVGGVIASIIAVSAPIFRKLGQQTDVIHELDKRLTINETRFNLFWDYYEKEVPKVLLKPHTPEIDAYLRKMERGETLTDDDKRDFIKHMRNTLEEGYDSRYDMNKDVKGVYAFLIARFESELEMKERKMPEIDRQYQEEKHRGWKFW